MKLKSLVIALVLGFVTVAAFAFTPAPAQAAREGSTIYEIASSSEDFEILTAALEATGLDAALDGNRQFTVFAPTDDAFVALLGELGLTPEELLSDTDLVTAVLLYHVSPGRRYAEDVLSSDKIRMLNQSFAAISVMNGSAYIDDAQIIATDIEASNGVIHVIDAVILP